MSNLHPDQFGEMHTRLKEEGGFTFDPRQGSFVTSGYSVGAHPEAELRIPQRESTPESVESYAKKHAPTWSPPEAKEDIGGWASDEQHVLDLPEVHPATPVGHAKSRRALIQHRQEASFALHDFSEEFNPFHPETKMGKQFPEFSRMSPPKQLSQPEIQAWIRSPIRRDRQR